MFAHRLDAGGEVAGTTVAQVIAVDGGDDDIAKLHGLDGAGQIQRLTEIQGLGFAMGNITEGTAPGTDVSHDHKGGRAVAEAFPQVRAGRFLADGMQRVLAQDGFQLGHSGATGGTGADPVGLAWCLFRGDDLDGNTGDLLLAALVAVIRFSFLLIHE